MSTSSEPPEPINWELSISEIAELLQTLGISPPRSLDENFLSTSPGTWRIPSEFDDKKEPEIHDCFSEGETTEEENFDREKIIERLEIAREDGEIFRWKNDYFHDYLVEHFRRKQMMHVCTNDYEDDVLLNEYLRKLDELEKSNEEVKGSREEWDAELTRTRAEIRGRKKDARDAVDKMIEKEREVGSSTWYCGKPLSIKRVQTLISRQLDRIKDIAKFRIRYTRLRDDFIASEVALRRCSISSPNLTKEDYVRLEAEQFRYKRELTIIDEESDKFKMRREKLVSLMDAINRRVMKTNRAIDNCENIIMDLKNSMRTLLEEKKIWLRKLAEAKNFIIEFNEIIGQSKKPEFSRRISNMQKEHEEWMKKISSLLRDIKNLGQSLNSLKANLMLHGKNLERITLDNSDKSLAQ